MTNRKNLWVLGVVMSLALGGSLFAQYGDRDRDRDDRREYRGRWVYLGSARVDGARDHDEIRVGRQDGQFRAIQLQVNGGAIEFQRMVVHFGNGSQEELNFRERIPSGSRTRPIDLPGDRRFIRSVELWYGKENWHRRPKVSLYGIR
jgi:hypothetical protein